MKEKKEKENKKNKHKKKKAKEKKEKNKNKKEKKKKDLGECNKEGERNCSSYQIKYLHHSQIRNRTR